MANKVNGFLELPEIATPSTPSSGVQRIYAKTDGNLYGLNPSGVETNLAATGGTNVSMYSLNSNFSSSSSTLANVTGLAHSMISGKSYRFEFIGLFQSATNTVGISLGVSGTGTFVGSFNIPINEASASTSTDSTISSSNSTLTSVSVGTTNTSHWCRFICVVHCTGNSTFNVRFASETGGTVNLMTGSTLIVTQLN